MRVAEEAFEMVHGEPSPGTKDKKALFGIANKIQFAVRLQKEVYEVHGPDIFCTKSGSPAYFGKLSFGKLTMDATIPPAPFMVVSDVSSSAQLAKVLLKTWHLPPPEVIFSISGSAQSLVLSPQLQQSFDRGLAAVATSSRAWIVSGGTDTGVMKILGDFKFRYRESLANVPLIGVAPWGIVSNRAPLEGTRGSTVMYAGGAADRSSAPLNPHHTHFVLVDSGKQGGAAWGSETRTRSMVENRFAEDRRVPSVMIIIQGGPGTLDAILATAQQRIPIILLVDSGGAATAIADYLGDGASSEWREQFPPSLPHSKVEAMEKVLQQIIAVNEKSGKTLVHLFKISSGVDMSTVIMKAIISTVRMRPPPSPTRLGKERIPLERKRQIADAGPEGSSRASMTTEGGRQTTSTSGMNTKAMGLAISWNRPDAVRLILATKGARAASTAAAAKGLQRALELRRGSIVRTLLALPEMRTKGVVMAKLYVIPDEFGFCESDVKLQKALTKDIATIFSPATSDATLHNIYQAAIGQFLLPASPTLSTLIKQGTHTMAHDIFFWLTIQGDQSLAQLFWQRSKKPIHVALLGARLCKAMAQTVFKGKQALFARGDEYEQWAVETMDEAPEEELAFRVLRADITENGRADQTLLDLAMACDMKAFLFHRHCRSLMDLWWRGGYEGAECVLEPKFSWTLLTLFSACPLINPHVLTQLSGATLGRTRKWDGRSRRNVGLQALTATMGLVVEERRKAVTHAETGEPASAMTPREIEQRARASGISIGDHLQRDDMNKERTSRHRKAKGNGLTLDLSSIFNMLTCGVLALPLVKRLLSFYSIPAVCFLNRFLVHIAFLCVYAMLIFTTDELKRPDSSNATALIGDGGLQGPPGFKTIEAVWLLFEVGLFLDQRHQKLVYYRMGRKELVDGFTLAWWLVDIILVSAIACRAGSIFIELEPNLDLVFNLYTIYMALVSFNSILIAMLALPYLAQIHGEFGVLVIIVDGMLRDVVLFAELFIVGAIGFSFCFVGLGRGGLYDSPDGDLFSTNYGALSVPWWATYGAFDLVGHSWTSSVLLFISCLWSNVLLVNLLIAMMSDTYARVKEKSAIEHTFVRYACIFHHRHVVMHLPPVLNLPFVVYSILFGSKRQYIGMGGGNGRSSTDLLDDAGQGLVEALMKKKLALANEEEEERVEVIHRGVTPLQVSLEARLDGITHALDELRKGQSEQKARLDNLMTTNSGRAWLSA